MSCLTVCASRRRARREKHPGRLMPQPGTPAGRSLRRGAAGVAGTGLVYGGLLALTADDNPLFGTGRLGSAAEAARPYGTALSTGWTAFSEATAQLLSRAEAFAAWPLLALTLLWLAARHQSVYLRGALALLVSHAGGLVVFASVRGLPADEAALVRDYLALPGVRAGWYVLLALAVVASGARFWIRAAATAVALLAGTAAMLTTDHHPLGTLWATLAPLLAWYGLAVLRSGRPAPEADMVSLQPHAGGLPEQADAEPVPLRRAG